MHSFEFRWQPINIGIVIDFHDKYLAIGLVFWTYRYNGLAVRANKASSKRRGNCPARNSHGTTVRR